MKAKVRQITRRAAVRDGVPVSEFGTRSTGELKIGGKHLKVNTRDKGYGRLHRSLEANFGLVISGQTGEPLLVMRLGDFLKQMRLRGSR